MSTYSRTIIREALRRVWPDDDHPDLATEIDHVAKRLQLTLDTDHDAEATAWVRHLETLFPVSDGAKRMLRVEVRVLLERCREMIDAANRPA